MRCIIFMLYICITNQYGKQTKTSYLLRANTLRSVGTILLLDSERSECNMKILTWSDFDQFVPCYSPQEKYGDFKGTILDILKNDKIPNEDKIWAATREGILETKTLQIFACKCVREVWHLLEDERSRKAVEVAELYIEGKCTIEELNNAAWDAAWAARTAWDAWDAAWAARTAWDAWDAAWAARAAARAAWDARAARDAWDAARAAWDARDKQVQILINLLQ